MCRRQRRPTLHYSVPPLLELENVTVVRGERAALQNIWLHIDHLQRATAALARLGISHLADRPLVQMSSGEAKRALIARALVHQPDTLLFDEPSSALDIAAQLQLRETMRELARSGLAILLVTHHVSEIIPEIDRVILLRDGQILIGWTCESTFTRGRSTSTESARAGLPGFCGGFYSKSAGTRARRSRSNQHGD